MAFLIGITITLVLATTLTAIYTGKRLIEMRKEVFKLEMAREEMRRQLASACDRQLAVQGNLDILRGVRADRLAAKATLNQELRVLQGDRSANREIGVSDGLLAKTFDLASVAA